MGKQLTIDELSETEDNSIGEYIGNILKKYNNFDIKLLEHNNKKLLFFLWFCYLYRGSSASYIDKKVKYIYDEFFKISNVKVQNNDNENVVQLHNFIEKYITFSSNFIIDKDINFIISNTDTELSTSLKLPFESIFLDCHITINDEKYIPCILLLAGGKEKKWTIFYLVINSNYDNFAERYYIGTILWNENTQNKEYKLALSYCISFLKFLYNPEVEICKREYTKIRRVRKEEKLKFNENHYYIKVNGKLRKYINEIDIKNSERNYLRKTYSWIVRGYYKKLLSNFWKNKQGQEVFVPPFICGVGKTKRTDYILKDKILWKNEMLMITMVRRLFPNHIVLENTRGVLNGLELDCYIPDLRIAFEYDGLQHYQYPNPFHKTEKDFKRQISSDKEKNELCKELGINLVRIKYDEIVSEELINSKVGEILK